MKKKKLLFIHSKINIHGCFLIFIPLLILGCISEETQLTPEEPTAVIESSTMTPTVTEVSMIPTSTSTLMPTQTSKPTAIMIPSATPTITPSTTATAIRVPTLTTTEEQVLYQELMTTNGGCDLPCWWGIELGESLESVNQKFINLGMPWLGIDNSYKVESDQMGTFRTGSFVEDGTQISYRLSVYTEFHELNNAVEYIYINVNRPIYDFGQQEIIRDWEQYYLNSFLQRYGKPTQVYFRIRTVSDFMVLPQFSVSLLYREKGLAITYHIDAIWLDEAYTQAELCLNIENLRALELSLFDPDGYDIWGYQFAPYLDERYKALTWEAEIGMPLDTFYETYQHPENLNCLFLSSG